MTFLEIHIMSENVNFHVYIYNGSSELVTEQKTNVHCRHVVG
jgi:hypothetical protein